MCDAGLQPGSPRWNQLIAEGAAALEVSVSDAQIEAMACHARELLKWNRKINLTRILDPGEMALKHYVDSLACVPHIPAAARILDIGTGGGFPGVPVAVAARPQEALLIDSVGKKISFLQNALRLMNLDNTRARHIRAQDLRGEAPYREYFDRVVCRALTGLDQVVELAFPLLKKGGVVVALKGRAVRTAAEASRLDARADAGVAHAGVTVVPYHLPLSDSERSLVLIKK